MGASKLAPPMSWSQIIGQTPGYGQTSSGSATTQSSSMGDVPGYVVPPPGFSPPDFFIWSVPPPPETPLPPGLPIFP